MDKMSETNSPNIDFILKYKELIAQLLELASDKFSNHGCNDFRLTDCLLTRAERYELEKELATTLFGEDNVGTCNPEDDYSLMRNDKLMSFFAEKMRELTN